MLSLVNITTAKKNTKPCKVFTTIINQRGLKSNRNNNNNSSSPYYPATDQKKSNKTTEKRPPHQLSLSHIQFSQLLIFGEPKSYKVFSSSTKSHQPFWVYTIWMRVHLRGRFFCSFCVLFLFRVAKLSKYHQKCFANVFFLPTNSLSFCLSFAADMWNLFTEIGDSDMWTMGRFVWSFFDDRHLIFGDRQRWHLFCCCCWVKWKPQNHLDIYTKPKKSPHTKAFFPRSFH